MQHCAGGHGLTTAAREDPLPWERQGSRGKGGEGSARLSNGYRVNAAPKGIVKADSGWAESAHQRAFQRQRPSTAVTEANRATMRTILNNGNATKRATRQDGIRTIAGLKEPG